MTLYQLLKYTPKEKMDVEYLLDVANEMNCLDDVQESMFQFHPSLLDEEEQLEGFGEHEPFAVFHKKLIMNEIIFNILKIIYTTDYSQEDAINSQIWNETYTPFMLKNDLRNLTKDEIINKFKEYFNID